MTSNRLASAVGFLRRWGAILKAAGKNWLDSQAFIYAAALAFFTVFSIAPVMIVIVAVVGLFLGEETARIELMSQIEAVLGAQATGVVETAIENSQIESGGLWPTVAGIAATAVGATTVFAQMQKSLNQIWDVAPRPSRNSIWLFIKTRVLSLTIVLAIGFVLLVSLLLSVLVRAVMTHAEQWLPVPGWTMIGIEILLSLAVVTMLFAAIFRILPDVALRWSEVLAGAFVTALLFTLGRSLIAWYLANTAVASAYGAAGSLVLLLLWVNYSSLILLFGASICRSRLEADNRPIRPRNTAVRVHRELIEDSGPQKGR
ncbi:YihY/virulence factor BrkB family protein [Wenzhouxiangella sp. XN201]|uniref:YihY/virulence factor BrkB family protein n=1 Tax=Wenzhouxiangella sp. XN201 TaxID=2710755 RepID=UPI0013C6DC7A|nr:YihY/virulence factor BrkB family protein [Wenzhouxiangella sp. XN201]NEZ03339.1 YihY/virulence factor BrkB family protein [Wenzhouxiangella sp. XN201]